MSRVVPQHVPHHHNIPHPHSMTGAEISSALSCMGKWLGCSCLQFLLILISPLIKGDQVHRVQSQHRHVFPPQPNLEDLVASFWPSCLAMVLYAFQRCKAPKPPPCIQPQSFPCPHSIYPERSNNILPWLMSLMGLVPPQYLLWSSSVASKLGKGPEAHVCTGRRSVKRGMVAVFLLHGERRFQL